MWDGSIWIDCHQLSEYPAAGCTLRLVRGHQPLYRLLLEKLFWKSRDRPVIDKFYREIFFDFLAWPSFRFRVFWILAINHYLKAAPEYRLFWLNLLYAVVLLVDFWFATGLLMELTGNPANLKWDWLAQIMSLQSKTLDPIDRFLTA